MKSECQDVWDEKRLARSMIQKLTLSGNGQGGSGILISGVFSGNVATRGRCIAVGGVNTVLTRAN